MKYHFIRDMAEKDIIKLRYCNALDNIIDIITKGVVKTQLLNLRRMLVSSLNIKGNNVGNLAHCLMSKIEFLEFFSSLFIGAVRLTTYSPSAMCLGNYAPSAVHLNH